MRMCDRPLWSLTAAGISLGDGLGPPPAAGPLSFRPPAQYDPGDGRMVPTRQGRSARRSSRGQSLYHARTTRWRSCRRHRVTLSPRAPGQPTPANNPRAPGPTLEGAGSRAETCPRAPRRTPPGRTRPRASRATVPGHDCPHVTPPPAGYCPSPITNPSVAVRNHPPVTHPHEPSRRRPSSPSPHGGEGAGG